ncbi:MAG: hypothetical protein ACP5RN_00545 [Armatimonadota bacterium]
MRRATLLLILILVILTFSCRFAYAYDIFFSASRPYGTLPDVIIARAMPSVPGEQIRGWELWIGHWSEDAGIPMPYYRVAQGTTALETTYWEIYTTQLPYSAFLSQGAKYGYTFIVTIADGRRFTYHSGMFIRP